MKLASAGWGLIGAVALAACDTRVEARDTPASAGSGGSVDSRGSAGIGGSAGSDDGAGSDDSAGGEDGAHAGAANSAGGADAREGPACADGSFAWPGAARAAVSLTYDDGLPSQLEGAVPALEASGLVATLFLSESYAGFEARKPAYQALVAKGFEMAGHTVNHPCFGLTPDLATYDEAALGAELDQNISTLRSLGMQGELTFAYPCGHAEYGEPPQSYVPLIEQRFFAARGVDCCAEPPAAVDLYDVHTFWPAETATPADVQAAVDRAIASGTWLVFGFHAVGAATGEWSAVPQETHDALIDYLVARESELWVGTFGAVADYVQRCR